MEYNFSNRNSGIKDKHFIYLLPVKKGATIFRFSKKTNTLISLFKNISKNEFQRK